MATESGGGSRASTRFGIITIGDMCVDLIVDVGDAPIRFGQVEQWVPGYLLEMGGSCCLFACQAAKLGLRVGILGRVGDDAFGHLILRRLRDSRVDTRFVRIDAGLKTGLGLALSRADGDRAILTYAGSLNSVYADDIDDQFLLAGRHLHYGSYYLQTNLMPAVCEILARAKTLGLSVSLDANWDPAQRWDGGLLQTLRHVDLLLLNANEAMAISATRSLEEAAAALRQHVPLVALKLGAGGAYVASREGTAHLPVSPVERIVDTVGAGDSFDAGFLAGWLRGLTPERCAALGNACGRATLSAAGGLAGQLRRADLRELD